MRNCDYYEELISRSLDDELSVEERKALAVHLASCPSCSQMRMLMADVSRLMEEDMEELPGGLHEDIMAAVRRSEMIKKNGGSAKAANTGRAGRNSHVKRTGISRPVRNLLATAACMALVIAAAISLNPGQRAEDVVASRNAPLAAADFDQRSSAESEPQMSPSPSPTVQPSPNVETQQVQQPQEVQPQQSDVQNGENSIITQGTDPYGDWRTPIYPENSQASDENNVQNRTIINPATPTPQPVYTPAPSPVVTPTPEIQAQQPEVQPQEDESQAQQQDIIVEGNVTLEPGAANLPQTSAAQAPESDAQPDTVGEVHKTAPTRVFSLFSSLAELIPAETSQPQQPQESAAPAADAAQATPTPCPTPCHTLVEMDLMEEDNGKDVLLMLMGMLDEDGAEPTEVEKPEAECDSCYVISMVYDEIPCEVTALIYGDEVYFSLAEIVVEPGNGQNGTMPELPAQTPAEEGSFDVHTPITGENSADAQGQTGNGNNVCPITGAESQLDFEPIWFLSDCTGSEFITLLDSFNK